MLSLADFLTQAHVPTEEEGFAAWCAKQDLRNPDGDDRLQAIGTLVHIHALVANDLKVQRAAHAVTLAPQRANEEQYEVLLHLTSRQVLDWIFKLAPLALDRETAQKEVFHVLATLDHTGTPKVA